jgi:ABC-type Na+ efflux pump permease subunit
MVSAHYAGGCSCENSPGLRRHTNNVEITSMAAPRALFLAGSTGDWTKNLETVEAPDIASVYKHYKMENMPEHFFVKLFAVMFVGMAPLTCMSAIISEEKEKNTLRALMMSNVKPFEYLIGVGAYVFIMCIIGAVVFAVCGGYEGKDLLVFMTVMGAGILLSALTGAVIGVFSKNQMSATSITIPVMMIFSFLPNNEGRPF